MNSNDWELLLALSEEMNMTKTADRLYLSQSSVSYRIKNLEKEFGVPLLTRSKTGISFTPQGKYLLHYAKSMLDQYHNTKNHIRELDGKLTGELRIGVASALALNVFPQILKSFYSICPHAEIYLRSSKSSMIYQMLERKEITIAISRGEHLWGDEKHLLYEEPIGVVSTFPIELEDLPQYPYLSHPNSNINSVITAWWQQNYTVPPKTLMEVDNTDICLKMLLQGLGWSILPAVGLANYPALFFKELFWKDGLPLTRKTHMLYRRSDGSLPLVQAFSTYLTSVFPRYMAQNCAGGRAFL